MYTVLFIISFPPNDNLKLHSLISSFNENGHRVCSDCNVTPF